MVMLYQLMVMLFHGNACVNNNYGLLNNGSLWVIWTIRARGCLVGSPTNECWELADRRRRLVQSDQNFMINLSDQIVNEL